MIKSAVNKVSLVVIDPSSFRYPQKSDRFKVELVKDNARQYFITNQTNSTQYLVTFAVSASGNRLAACTCADFANIRKHGRQCKHIHVAYNFHIARCKAKQVAETVKAVDTTATAPVSRWSVITKDANGVERCGGVRI